MKHGRHSLGNAVRCPASSNLNVAPRSIYVAIFAGRKYFVTVHQTDESSARIPTIEKRALWLAQADREELRHCLVPAR